MQLKVKSRKQLNLGVKPTGKGNKNTPAANKRFTSSSSPQYGASSSNTSMSEIKRKSQQLQSIILDCFTNPLSDVHAEKVISKVSKEKPEALLGLMKSVIPKDVNVQVEEKRTVPVIIPALNRGANNGN